MFKQVVLALVVEEEIFHLRNTLAINGIGNRFKVSPVILKSCIKQDYYFDIEIIHASLCVTIHPFELYAYITTAKIVVKMCMCVYALVCECVCLCIRHMHTHVP